MVSCQSFAIQVVNESVEIVEETIQSEECMNLSRIKSRYAGIQSKLEGMDKTGCLFLCICTIIEEVTGLPCDIIGILQESMAKGWLDKDFTVKNSPAILHEYTGKKFRRVEVSTLPSVIKDNEFSIEHWVNPNTGKEHFKRRFVDTLTSSVTVKEGYIKEYYIYSY